MLPVIRRTTRAHHVTLAGTALAGALLPLVVGVLLARAASGDPMAPVSTFVTGVGARGPARPGAWRYAGRDALRRTRRPLRRARLLRRAA
ncbi:hypothetical protein [uncultured Streptomyces sp.]|uniref:hypothetical protein n=1 Tax=uncultured Streptomyces sp. TaxID=174707 RepID=UPI00260CDFB0|nr:hypothetical protein [uncultured Streptomyces sp.]